MLDHFRFLKSVAKAVPKMTIPSPTALHYRGGRQAIEKSVYPEMEPFFDDLGKAYAKAVRAFGEAGCTYLQLDEVFVAYLCDAAQRDYLRGRGDDPDRLLHVYADLVNAACAGRTPGMTISMHLCRGNFRSTWMAQGGYERGGRHPVQPDGRRRLFHGVRQRARRRLRAAAASCPRTSTSCSAS